MTMLIKNKTVPYDVLDFIECAISIDMGAAECAKVIKYYTGDEYTVKMKLAIADSILEFHGDRFPNTLKTEKIILILNHKDGDDT